MTPTRAAAPVSEWLYRTYQTADGLPDISISGVAQTADGFLWVATKGGVASFNGQKFSVLPRGNFPRLPSRSVRAMLRDRRDQLWLGMERGPLLCLSADGLEIYAAEEGLPDQRVVMLTEDREGAVWVVYPAQLRRVQKGHAEAVALPPNWAGQADLVAARDAEGNIWCAKDTLLGGWRNGAWRAEMSLPTPITALGPGARSGLWIGAGGELFKLEGGHTLIGMGRLPNEAVSKVLLEDAAGALWVGSSSEGLFRWHGQKWERVATSQQEITCLLQDRERNILVGTGGGGLDLIRPRAVALIGREAGLPSESVQSVSEDTAGCVWAATQDGQLARMKDGRWEVVSSAADWPGGRASCVAADRKGGLWAGTKERGLKYFRDGRWREWLHQDGLAGEGVRSLLVASNGDVWAASISPNRLQCLRDGRLLTVISAPGLGAIRALAEATDGTIWIGTAVGEIQKVRGSVLVAEPAIAEPVPLSVRCLLATADGSLWIGYAGEGLGHLRNGHYHRLTTADGLADDFISQLLPDGSGNLWIAGNRGLWRVSFSELDAVLTGRAQRLSVRTYGSADGLPGLQPNRDYCPSACRGRDGRLWFSMRNGLLVADPDKIRDNPLPPLVQVERVAVDDQLAALYNAGSPLQLQSASNVVNLRNLAGPLRLGPGHRKLEIEFAALSFTSPENVRFRYRLSGFDPDWADVGGSRRATYPRLPAGNYEFRVLACNNAGVWNDTGAVVAFTVSPFFWETWWCKTGGALLMALLTGGSAFAVSRTRYRRRLRRLEARRALEHERARIAKDIHDDLGASLTRISLLSQPAPGGTEEAQTAAQSLAQIHQTARDLTHAMGEVVWAVNPEHDTFDSLANYVSNYAQNFLRVAGIRCRIEMPMQLPRQSLSAEIRHNLFLAFKEALNNVVKHAGASEVRISLVPGETGFELVIADNGHGFSPGRDASRPTPGNGLINMRSRLREIGGACDVQSAPGAGTKITFCVNWKPGHGKH